MLECIHTHAWLNLWDKHMTTGRINQVFTLQHLLTNTRFIPCNAAVVTLPYPSRKQHTAPMCECAAFRMQTSSRKCTCVWYTFHMCHSSFVKPMLTSECVRSVFTRPTHRKLHRIHASFALRRANFSQAKHRVPWNLLGFPVLAGDCPLLFALQRAHFSQ